MYEVRAHIDASPPQRVFLRQDNNQYTPARRLICEDQQSSVKRQHYAITPKSDVEAKLRDTEATSGRPERPASFQGGPNCQSNEGRLGYTQAVMKLTR